MYLLNACTGIVTAKKDVLLGQFLYGTTIHAVLGVLHWPYSTRPFQCFDVKTAPLHSCSHFHEWSEGQLVWYSSAFVHLAIIVWSLDIITTTQSFQKQRAAATTTNNNDHNINNTNIKCRYFMPAAKSDIQLTWTSLHNPSFKPICLMPVYA